MRSGFEVFDVRFNTIDEAERFVPMSNIVLNQGFLNNLGDCGIVYVTNIRKNMVGNVCVEPSEQEVRDITVWVKINGSIDLMTEP